MSTLTVIDELLQLMETNLVGLTFISVLLCHFLSSIQARLFCLITFVFFLFGSLIHSTLFEIDSGYIYRYLIWAFNDIAWMGLIAYLTMKDKIHLWQSILGQLIVLPAPLLQLMRLVDRHYFDLSYTTYLYKTLLPIINMATVVLCFAPLIVVFSNYLKNRDNKEQAKA